MWCYTYAWGRKIYIKWVHCHVMFLSNNALLYTNFFHKNNISLNRYSSNRKFVLYKLLPVTSKCIGIRSLMVYNDSEWVTEWVRKSRARKGQENVGRTQIQEFKNKQTNSRQRKQRHVQATHRQSPRPVHSTRVGTLPKAGYFVYAAFGSWHLRRNHLKSLVYGFLKIIYSFVS